MTRGQNDNTTGTASPARSVKASTVCQTPNREFVPEVPLFIPCHSLTAGSLAKADHHRSSVRQHENMVAWATNNHSLQLRCTFPPKSSEIQRKQRRTELAKVRRAMQPRAHNLERSKCQEDRHEKHEKTQETPSWLVLFRAFSCFLWPFPLEDSCDRLDQPN